MEATANVAWGFYCRFLLEAGKFYSFDLLRPGLFLYVSETKSVPNRAPPAPSEALWPARRGPPAPRAAPTVPVGAPADRPLWAPLTPAPAPHRLPEALGRPLVVAWYEQIRDGDEGCVVVAPVGRAPANPFFGACSRPGPRSARL